MFELCWRWCGCFKLGTDLTFCCGFAFFLGLWDPELNATGPGVRLWTDVREKKLMSLSRRWRDEKGSIFSRLVLKNIVLHSDLRKDSYDVDLIFEMSSHCFFHIDQEECWRRIRSLRFQSISVNVKCKLCCLRYISWQSPQAYVIKLCMILMRPILDCSWRAKSRARSVFDEEEVMKDLRVVGEYWDFRMVQIIWRCNFGQVLMAFSWSCT